MPLYEYYQNAQNCITMRDKDKEKIAFGTTNVILSLSKMAKNKHSIGLDGWYGVDWDAIINPFCEKMKQQGISVEIINIYDVYKNEDFIQNYQKKYETEDPSFGWVNEQGSLKDLMDMDQVALLKTRLSVSTEKNKLYLVYGPGTLISELDSSYDCKIYIDFTMQPMLWKMWDGELVPFGSKKAVETYNWKKYYYNDFYLLYRHKKQVFSTMDYYISAAHIEKCVMIPRDIYNCIIDELVKRPIKQVKILQPGPWGAYRYRDLWEVEGLECSAWNELAGIELSIVIDLGGEADLNIPTQNIMQRPVELVGEYIHTTYPDLFPLQVWLDDGYFPESVSFERSSMPMHDHPSSEYGKRCFNEPIGRYETYYIVESYKGSSTWMGYKEDANLEEWESRCRDSQNLKKIDNWQDYVCRWDSNVGDLFLIPPGTTHGHGGNQMILEMDTGPSVAGTEYSFFTYDYNRNTWDDKNKTMTAKPMKMHTKHSFDNQKWIRENRVKSHHRARPIAVDGNGKYRKDQYTTLPEMPFHIERIFMEERAENDTEGKYVQIATLAEGKKVTIRSLQNPEYSTTIDRLQSCIIPACFGEHEYINEEGNHALVVLIRMKKA